MNTQKNKKTSASDVWHEEAMDIALPAMRALKSNQLAEAKKLFRQAFELEEKAAFAYSEKSTDEAWRAMLFRSAAWLALHGEIYQHAMRMAIEGLNGNPPANTEDELLDILEQALAQMKNNRRLAAKATA